MTMALDSYRTRAEEFVRSLDREYYDHYAGLKDTFEIGGIYQAHRDLFTRDAVLALRELAGDLTKAPAAARWLLLFGVSGHIGRANESEEAQIARREARLDLDLDGAKLPFRQSTSVQANEPAAARRAEIEARRLELIEKELNPLYSNVLQRSHELAAELGWPSYGDMLAALKDVDLAHLERQTEVFLDTTDGALAEIVEPALKAQLGFGFGAVRRADLPHFFRATRLDAHYPDGRSLACFERTLAGLGIRLGEQRNITIDAERRPRKSPRAFCAAVEIPDEIYLVTAPIGGRDDYSMLFHEGGHAEHYAHVDRALGFEAKYLGDSSVTEGYAFLFDHLIDDPAWLEEVLEVPADAIRTISGHARAARLLLVRRYAAKLSYELALHRGGGGEAGLRATYARLLSRASGTAWPDETYLSDVDAGFYVASYLRAWGMEASMRQHLRNRFGTAWFKEREAGDLLKSLWRLGQSLPAEDLLESIGAEPISLELVRADLVDAG